jgi:hypothetical protein
MDVGNDISFTSPVTPQRYVQPPIGPGIIPQSPCSDATAGVGTFFGGIVGAIGQAGVAGGAQYADIMGELERLGIAAGTRGEIAGNIARAQGGGLIQGWNGVGLLWALIGGVVANHIKDNIDRDTTLTPQQREYWKSVVDYANWIIGTAIGLAALAAAPVTGGAIVAFALGTLLGMPGKPLDSLGSYLGGLFGRGCNGDPYFVQPDIRQINSTRRGGITLAFAQGGQYPDPGPATLATTPDPTLTATTHEYRDRAESLINGSVPDGGTTIGEWVWDADQPFNGLSSHTNNALTGTNLHYYIGGAPPHPTASILPRRKSTSISN